MSFSKIPKKFLSKIKERWYISLIALLLLAGLIIFYSINNTSNEITTALIVIVPASFYYIYTEFLDQPTVSIKKEVEHELVPVEAPQESKQRIQSIEEVPVGPDASGDIDPETFEIGFEGGNTTNLNVLLRSPVVRPVVFSYISIKNSGKSTAKDARIQFKLENSEGDEEFYGRWTDPSNSEQYDLLPKEEHSVFVFKCYITEDFYPGFTILNTHGYDEELKRDHIPFRISSRSVYGPNGIINWISKIVQKDITPRTFFPVEKIDNEKSGTGKWKGAELGGSKYGLYDEEERKTVDYTLKCRLIADNYASPWEEIKEITIPDDIIEACESKENWNDKWEDPFLQRLEEDLESSLTCWSNNNKKD